MMRWRIVGHSGLDALGVPVPVLEENPELKVGDRRRFFHYDSWSRVGDVGDNDEFFLPATVVFARRDDRGRQLVDITWDYKTAQNVHYGFFTEDTRSIK